MVERRFLAVGRMNFMPGKSCCSLLPDETVGLRNSMPNRSPLLPRPWSRMKVCVCWEDGGITRGSG